MVTRARCLGGDCDSMDQLLHELRFPHFCGFSIWRCTLYIFCVLHPPQYTVIGFTCNIAADDRRVMYAYTIATGEQSYVHKCIILYNAQCHAGHFILNYSTDVLYNIVCGILCYTRGYVHTHSTHTVTILNTQIYM